MVLEVSQKQSFIFNEKRLRNNIFASNVIAYVTSSDFFTKKFSEYFNEQNMVYAGGGHTFLIFDTKEEALKFAKAVSAYVLKEFPGLELFIKVMSYLPEADAGEKEKADFAKFGPVARIRTLTDELEKKKGKRAASFFQTSFGIENSGRRRSISDKEKDGNVEKIDEAIRKEVDQSVLRTAPVMKDGEAVVNVEVFPDGYKASDELKNLVGTESEKNFIAIIHIDGNQMGNRVTKLKENIDEKLLQELTDRFQDCSKERQEFEVWRAYSRMFSESIDYDFKKALGSVYKDVAYSLEDPSGIGKEFYPDGISKKYFPLRKIIAAGDDICFITDGRIGLECAVRFIEHLEEQRNSIDGLPYHACAGVAIVHQKYPFYRAYDMAEQLCSNAKKVMMRRIEDYNKEEGCSDAIPAGGLSAIDWHIEYGEMVGSLDDIRENMTSYEKCMTTSPEGESVAVPVNMFARPYQVFDAAQQYGLKASEQGAEYTYQGFRRLLLSLLASTEASDRKERGSLKPYLAAFKASEADLKLNVARNKQKTMRNAIKDGDSSYKRFIAMNRITDRLTEYADMAQVFDALEALDLFLPIREV